MCCQDEHLWNFRKVLYIKNLLKIWNEKTLGKVETIFAQYGTKKRFQSNIWTLLNASNLFGNQRQYTHSVNWKSVEKLVSIQATPKLNSTLWVTFICTIKILGCWVKIRVYELLNWISQWLANWWLNWPELTDMVDIKKTAIHLKLTKNLKRESFEQIGYRICSQWWIRSVNWKTVKF